MDRRRTDDFSKNADAMTDSNYEPMVSSTVAKMAYLGCDLPAIIRRV